MFPCPNCGGQLRFSVKNQQLKCRSCGELVNVDTYKPDDKIGFDAVNTNVYSCTSCGGEIQLIDNDGMEFCPFCGNQATMQEKFSTEGAPRYILPFGISKLQAKNKYKKDTEKIHYAPDGLADDDNVDKLVGLYTPYYLYDYTVKDAVSFQGIKSSNTADYTITNYANVTVRVSVDDLKIPFDASQVLDDTISTRLEPFPMENVKPFNPNYLAGFFVENSSVDKNLYTSDSQIKAADYVYEKTIDRADGYTPINNGDQKIYEQLTNDLQFRGVDGAYLPLYFMTTRYNDRVAYSIINGANGNSYIDMPIDKTKMFKAAVLLSAFIFAGLLLASFILSFSFKVKSLCAFAAVISSIIALVGAILANDTYRSDNHLDDKGYFGTANNASSTKPKKFKPKKRGGNIVAGGWMLFFIFIFIDMASGLSSMMGSILVFACYAASVVMVIMSLIKVKQGKKQVMLLGIVGWALAVFVRLIDLPNDIYYYGALVGVFVVILISINAIVDEYNRFATHPSPQFFKKGGGLESAKESI